MWTRTSRLWMLLLALGVGSAPITGCGDDDEETTAEEDESTSGGEDTATGLEQPEGSREPDEEDDGSWDGDDEPSPDDSSEGSGSDGEASGDGTEGGDEQASGEAEEEEPSNPWGATRAEQCAQPERPNMNTSAQRSFDSGVAAASSGNAAQARSAFQAALSADGNAFKAAYNLGVLADRSGNENQALEFYRRALRILPGYERAAEGIVTIHLRRGSVPDALAFVEPLARNHRTNLHLQALYAEVLVQNQRYDQAWNAARQALRCDERFVPALTAVIKASLRQGREELADSILDQALQIEDGNAELHFIRGTRYRDQPGRFRDALNEFQRAVQLRPDYSEARMALGISQLAGGNYQEALTNFQAAARLSPTLVAVHLNLADAYRANKQWEQAKATFEKALQMEPNLAQAHFNLGLMYMTAGEEFPGLDLLQSLEKAKEEFTQYRNLMGPRLPRDDQSEAYLTDLDRQISRTRRRLEREAARARRDAERAAREAAEGGDTAEGGE